MSTSRQLSESRAIPTRTVLINDTTQLPHDYCTTPGGTLFSTTPGGNANQRCFFLCKGTGIVVLWIAGGSLVVSSAMWPNRGAQNKNKALCAAYDSEFKTSDWPSWNAVIEEHRRYIVTKD